MSNINGIINKSKIAKLNKEKNKVIAKCNCRDKVKCPLEGKCKEECVVYKVEFFSTGMTKLAFFFLSYIFSFPLGSDSRYFYLLFLAVFFSFCLVTVNAGR